MAGLIYLTDEEVAYLSGVIRGDKDVAHYASPVDVVSLLEKIENT